MKRLLTTSGILGLTVAAFALGSFFSVVQKTYNFAPTSAAGTAKCQLCHVGKMGGAALNAYGKDLKTALKGAKVLNATILHSIDGLDSNKDGVKNGDALKAGKLPG